MFVNDIKSAVAAATIGADEGLRGMYPSASGILHSRLISVKRFLQYMLETGESKEDLMSKIKELECELSNDNIKTHIEI